MMISSESGIRNCSSGAAELREVGPGTRWDSGQDLLDHMAVDVGNATVDAVMAEREARVVDPQEVEDRRVQVVAIRLAGGRLPGPGVALAVSRASLDAGAGQPGD